MNSLLERDIGCPYCGETINVLIDCSIDSQEYIEDCQVCCRPIIFRVAVSNDGDASISVYHENEV